MSDFINLVERYLGSAYNFEFASYNQSALLELATSGVKKLLLILHQKENEILVSYWIDSFKLHEFETKLDTPHVMLHDFAKKHAAFVDMLSFFSSVLLRPQNTKVLKEALSEQACRILEDHTGVLTLTNAYIHASNSKYETIHRVGFVAPIFPFIMVSSRNQKVTVEVHNPVKKQSMSNYKPSEFIDTRQALDLLNAEFDYNVELFAD